MSRRDFSIELIERGKTARRDVSIHQLIIAGWAGRDRQATEKHIVELEALGVHRPSATPIFYRASASLLTTAAEIEVLGANSSGEAECVLFRHENRLWVSVGSDHTDRKLETHNVAVSKQMCAKPIAPTAWPLAEVEEHWDSLLLRSWILENDDRVPYQEGLLAGLLPPSELLSRHVASRGLPDGTAMFCGTLAAIGGIRPSPRFEFELEDPVLGRKIAHAYSVVNLPLVE